jgi:hypothetical protein
LIDLVADNEDDGENAVKPSANENRKTDSDAADTKPSGKSSATCQRDTGSNKKARRNLNYVPLLSGVSVERCGIPEANGIYARSVDSRYGIIFSKTGQRDGNEEKFVVMRRSEIWYISILLNSSKYFKLCKFSYIIT